MAENRSINIRVRLIDDLSKKANDVQNKLNGLENRRLAAEKKYKDGDRKGAAEQRKAYKEEREDLQKQLDDIKARKASHEKQLASQLAKSEQTKLDIQKEAAKSSLKNTEETERRKTLAAKAGAKEREEAAIASTVRIRAEEARANKAQEVEQNKRDRQSRNAGRVRNAYDMVEPLRKQERARQQEINDARVENRRRIRQEQELIRVEIQKRKEFERTGTFMNRVRYQTQKLSDDSQKLTARLSRVGLALRGVVVTGALIFARALVSIFVALAAQAVALAGSLVNVAGVLGGVLVAGAAQAIPVFGLLAGAMSRFSAIQEAVNQNDLMQKQQFGDTGDASAAADAANQIADAQEGVREAQENLTKAREEARKELRDLILAEKEAELAFRRSILSQKEAQASLSDRISSGEGSFLDLQSDMLAVPEARVSKKRSRNDLTDTRQDLRKAVKGGIDGMDGVKQATKALASAQRALADAQKSATEGMGSQSAAASNLEYFLSKLSPTEKKLYKTFVNFKERFEGVLKGVTDILFKSVLGSFGKIEKAIFNNKIISGFKQLAGSLGNAFSGLVKVVTSKESIDFWDKTLGRASSNLAPLTGILSSAYKIFMNLADAAAPAFKEILRLINGEFNKFEKFTSKKSPIRDFFDEGIEQLKSWAALIFSVVKLLGALFGASADSAKNTLDDLTKRIDNATEWVKKNQEEVKEFFDQTSIAFGKVVDILVTLGAALVSIFDAKSIETFSVIVDEVFIPGIVMAVEWFSEFVNVIQDFISVPFVKNILKWAFALKIATASFSLLFAMVSSLFNPIKALFKIFGGGPKIGGWIKKLSPFVGLLKIFKEGGLLAGIRAFSKGFLIVGIAIELVIGTFMALKDNFLGVRDALVDALSGLGDAFGNLSKSFGGGGGFTGFLEGAWEVVKVISDIIGWIGKLAGAAIIFAAIEVIIKPLTAIINIIAEIVNVYRKFVNDVKKGGLGEAFKNLVGNVVKATFNIIKILLKQITRLPILIGKGILALGKIAVNALLDLAGLLLRTWVGAVKAIWGVISDPGRVWNALKGAGEAIADFIKSLPKSLMGILKSTGKAIWEGLILGLGANISEKVVNFFIGVLNKIIDAYNKLPILDDIDKLNEVDFTPKKVGKEPVAPRGERKPKVYTGEIDKETGAQKKNNKAKQDAAKFNGANYKALGLNAKATGKSTRQNKNLAAALQETAKGHKRAKYLQDSLNKSSQKGLKTQSQYIDSLRTSVKAEERLAQATARAKRAKGNYAEAVRNSSKAQSNFNDNLKNSSKNQSFNTAVMMLAERKQEKYQTAVKSSSRTQENFAEKTGAAFRTQTKLNQEISEGSKNQVKYGSKTKQTSKKVEEQSTHLKKLSRRFTGLSEVLKTTGKNSVALGDLFKTVTNRILTKFNVKPLSIKLPSADSVFENSTGSVQGFASGGYFGDKNLRNPDDRIIAVAGGEAILTGYHQPEVNKALSFANAHGVTKYGNLDSMFMGEKRPHYTAPAYNTGGKVPGFASGGYPGVTGDTDFAPALGAALSKMAIKSGVPIYVQSGGRTMAEQAALYQAYLNGTGNLAAAPTPTAPHIRGIAADITPGSEVFGSLAGGFGLGFTVPGESWHIELLSGAGFAGGMMAPMFKKIQIEGPEGVPKDMLSGQEVILRKAANNYLKENLPTDEGGSTPAYSPVTSAIIPGKKIRTGYTVYDDPPPGSFGALDNGYAELGTATTSGLTGGGYLAQGFGMPGELPENFPLNVSINGRSKKLYKRDRGWGQGSNSHGIDIWLDSWDDFGLNSMSSGEAILTAANYAKGGMIPEFNNGGVVPGKMGEPVLAKVHAGETILPTHRRFSGGGVAPRSTDNDDSDNDKKKKKKAWKPKPMKWLEDTPLEDFSAALRGLFAALKPKFKKSSDTFKKEIKNLDDRLEKFFKSLADANSKIEKEVARRARKITQWAYKVIKGVVMLTKSEQQLNMRELKNLKDYTSQLTTQKDLVDKAKQELIKQFKQTNKKQKDLRKKLRFSINKLNNESIALQDKINENLVSQYEIQREIVEETMAKFDVKRSAIDAKIRMQELLGELNSGDEKANKGQITKLINADTRILKNEQKAILNQLRKAKKAGNQDLIDELNAKLDENKIAIIENSIRLKELNETTEENTDATKEQFNFTDTLWEQFRVAVLQGTGINPNLQSSIPTLATGGVISRDGLAYLHAAEVVVPANESRGLSSIASGPIVENINFTQPMEVADPVAISNQIGFKLSTLKTV